MAEKEPQGTERICLKCFEKRGQPPPWGIVGELPEPQPCDTCGQPTRAVIVKL
jgi:hypothetical protein